MEKFAFITVLWLLFVVGNTSADECKTEKEEDNDKCGYIFTSPRSMKTGATNQLQLRRYGKLDSCHVVVKVMYTDSYSSNESLAIEQAYSVKKGVADSFLPLYLKKFDNYVYNGKIILNGTCGQCRFGGSDKVYFSESKDKIILIQTDKPLYKENQNVLFRILSMDRKLKPSVAKECTIWVEDPNAVRLAQWKNVSLGKGIKQFEFPLSDEPVRGDWKISATCDGEVASTNFEVKEYVLPKFEVTIKQPPFVLINAEEIPITVCAKYTYGKPVKGYLKMNISLETYSWSNEKLPTIEHEGKIDGCFMYKINVSFIQSGGDYYIYRRPQIFCEVEESDTGIKRNATEYIQRQSSPFNLNFNRDPKFKAGLPYNGKLFAKNPDNSPAHCEHIQICYTCTKERVVMNGEWKATRTVKYCKNFTTDAEGVVNFIIPRQNTDTVGINLEAKSLKYAPKKTKTGVQPQNSLSQPQTSMSLTPWFSPTGSFIQIQQVEGTLLCGTKETIKVLFTAKSDMDLKLYYQVISQGEVIKVGSVNKCFTTSEDVSEEYEDKKLVVNHTHVQIVPPLKPSTDASDSSTSESKDNDCHSVKEARYIPYVGLIELDIPVQPTGMSSFFVLAHYILPSGEVVADSQKFNVEKCFKNQVKMQFGDEVKQPGTKTSIKVTGSPNSLCGIKVMDKSVSLMNSNDQLTPEKIFNLMDSLDTGMYYGVNHCNEDVPQPGLYSSPSLIMPQRPWSTSSYADSLSAFEDCSFLVISDRQLFTRPCKSRGDSNNIVYEDSSFNGFGGAVHSKVAMASTARRPAAPAPGPPAAAEKLDISATKSVVDVRNYFPETWLFQIEMTGPDGTYATKKKLPHTITEWVGSAVCINEEDGLGVSNTTTIRGFQAFFIDITRPYSLIRKEKGTITMTLFNYLENKSIPISAVLEVGNGLKIVGDSDTKCLCLAPGSSTSLKYEVEGVALGTQNMTARAESSPSCDACGNDGASDVVAKDAIEQEIIIEPEGFPVEESKTYLICTAGEGNEVAERKFSVKEKEDLVPDSHRAYIDLSGNVMGKPLKNIDKLVVLPTGCGEQNMVKFDPLVSIMQLLSKDDDSLRKIRSMLVTGYQRELQFRHSDGSFSAFGPQDRNGSMILTGFVCASFSKSQQYIDIDKSILEGCQRWIVDNQKEDGSFPSIGRTFDLNPQDSQEKNTDAITTAYVLKALLISNYENKTVIDKALAYLRESKIKSVQGTCMHAYALALAGETELAKELQQSIKEKAIKKGGVEYFQDLNATKSQRVITTACAIQLSLEISKLTDKPADESADDVLPLVMFLIEEMSPQGGFYSTQDTCAGLEALSNYASLTQKENVNMDVTVTGGLERSFKIDESNRMLVQRSKVVTVPSDLQAKAEGSGCVVAQKTERYNTYSPPDTKNYIVEVEAMCSYEICKEVKVFTSLSSKDKNIGMTVGKYNFPSGYVADRASCDELVGKNNIMRCDIAENRLEVYCDHVNKDQVMTFSFTLKQLIPVENTQPATVEFVDYYNPEKKTITNYTPVECDKSTGCNKEP